MLFNTAIDHFSFHNLMDVRWETDRPKSPMNDQIRTIHFFPGINPLPGPLDLGQASMPSLEKDRADWQQNLVSAASHASIGSADDYIISTPDKVLRPERAIGSSEEQASCAKPQAAIKVGAAF